MVEEDECCCGLIPCVCVTKEEAIQAKRVSDLRAMLQTTTAACDFCLMLPCLCDGETLEEEIEIIPPKSEKKVLPVDDYGRVQLQNTEEEVQSNTWIAEELEAVLKTHQRDGVRFLLSHVSKNQGCILADYMGLGKTIQLITTVHSFLVDGIQTNSKKTALVLCPTVCIMNWVQEFQKWLSPESLKHSPVYQMETSNSYKSNTVARIGALQEWKEKGGVMIMGYEMFRLLLNPSRVIEEPSLDVVTNASTGELQVADKKQSQIERQLRLLTSLLCSPGPDLVALDEGHRIKDPTSLLCTSLEKVETSRRIVLTGYPLQNSLAEYWCMVNFCRPGYLDTYEHFRQHFEKPILEGNDEISSKLTQELASLVLRRGRQLLNEHLPTKKEWILHCVLSPIQYQLYLNFLDRDRQENKQWDLFTTYTTLLQIINHPDVVYKRMQKDSCDDDEEEQDEAASEWQPVLSTTQKKKRKRPISSSRVGFDWAEDVIDSDYVPGVIEQSGKMVVLLQLIRESQLVGDKVVVFSQSVTTLETIGYFITNCLDQDKKETTPSKTSRVQKNKLKAIRSKASKSQEAKIPKRYLVIDGSISSAKRMDYINIFSDKSSKVDVLLVSTRAGAEGINLHAANRLVLFDVSWNPSHDHQSMCRSHRIGQTKDVHVYRFVSHDTMEEKIYDQQVKKVGLSSNIVDSTTLKNQVTSNSSFFAIPRYYSDILDNITHKLSGDEVLDKCLQKVGQWVPQYFASTADNEGD